MLSGSVLIVKLRALQPKEKEEGEILDTASSPAEGRYTTNKVNELVGNAVASAKLTGIR